MQDFKQRRNTIKIFIQKGHASWNKKEKLAESRHEGTVCVSCLCVTSYHRLSSLKQHNLLSHSFERSEAELSWVLCFQASPNCNPSVRWVTRGPTGERSPSKLPYVVGRIHFLAATGLKVLVSYWRPPSAPRSHSQLFATWASPTRPLALLSLFIQSQKGGECLTLGRA